jgi:integrase
MESRRSPSNGRGLTAADTATFLAAIEGDELRPMLYLVAMPGLRRGEAAGLCWPDLDLDEATLTISGPCKSMLGARFCCRRRRLPALAPWRWTAAPSRS